MLKKLSHVLPIGKRRMNLETFFHAMGDILTSFEIQDEPDDDGFQKDSENIRSYFRVVEHDIQTAVIQFEHTLKTSHGKQIEIDFGEPQEEKPVQKKGEAAVNG